MKCLVESRNGRRNDIFDINIPGASLIIIIQRSLELIE